MMFSSNSDSILEALSTIAAIRRQEETFYGKREPLYGRSSVHQHGSFNPVDIDIDEECRQQMASWCCQVIEFCQMSRGTVEIALSYLDRYLLSEQGWSALQDRSKFQLASMAALYTAIKIHEPRVIDPSILSALSQGAYSGKQIEEMEMEILLAIQWRVNPPTSLAFTFQYLQSIPMEVIDNDTKEAAYDLSKLQIEEFVIKPELATIKASSLGYCALMNSLESMGIGEKATQLIQCVLEPALTGPTDIDVTIFNAECRYIRNCLHESIEGTNASPKTMNGRTPSYHSILDLTESTC